MACVFCEIVAGERAAHVVLDTPAALGFLDTRPVFKGHVLLVPREHVTTLDELPPSALGSLFEAVQTTMRALAKAALCEGTFVAVNNVISQSVPHLHVHVVPRRKKDGLRGFFWPRHKYESDDEAADFAARIRAAVGG
jgi:histidine triad (HIT) family protein